MRLLAIVLLGAFPAFAQPAMPSWLVPYPDANITTKSFPAFTESSYTTPAAQAAVTEHYRKLFESANLPFVPNSDGVGVNIRATAPECDLLLSICAQPAGTLVRLSCAAHSPTYTSSSSTEVVTSSPRAGSARTIPPPQPRLTAAEMMERHQQLVAEMGIHKVYEDAPAPPLIWPSWLVHLRGEKLSIERGVDQSHREYLRANFVTSVPMSQIHLFYKDLLKAHDYPVYRSLLGTGQTTSGVVQNAEGYVEGGNYPNGSPGPRTEIRVRFSRFYLNEPIKVEIRFTTYDFKGHQR